MVAAYLTTMRDFVAWLAAHAGGVPFHLGLLTETAVRGYMDSLVKSGGKEKTSPSDGATVAVQGGQNRGNDGENGQAGVP